MPPLTSSGLGALGLSFLHQLVAEPAIYDAVQRAVGVQEVHRRAARWLPPGTAPLVLDCGGGTGLLRPHLPPDVRYLCLDNDPQKLSGYARHFGRESVLLADATRLPVPDGRVDAIFCVSLLHHLPDDRIPDLLLACHRALRPGGRLIVLDPVWDATHLPGRVLWALDRGSYPKQPAQLEGWLSAQFETWWRDGFRMWHRYLLVVGEKASSEGSVHG